MTRKIIFEVLIIVCTAVLLALTVNRLRPDGLPLFSPGEHAPARQSKLPGAGPYDVERAVFLTVLHRLMVSGSDRFCHRWCRDYIINGIEGLDLHHLYRAMGFLGEVLGEISMAEAINRFHAGEALFVDAREAPDFNAGHIPGAVNLTVGRYGQMDRPLSCRYRPRYPDHCVL